VTLGARLGRERPEELVERPAGLVQPDDGACVGDRRLDLGAVADDASVTEQPLDVIGRERGDAFRVEAAEELTERRSLDVYERIKRANTFLIVFGCTFLTVTLVFAVLGTIWPDRFRWEIAAVTGGVGLLQLVSAFVAKPA
jgi:hypothetical protein